MPVTFEQDKNGRIVPRGSITTAPPSAAAAPAAKPKPPQPQKSWWQSTLNNIEYERKRLTQDPGKRLGEIAKPFLRADPLNDVRYELKQLSDPKTALPRLGEYAKNMSAVSSVGPGGAYGLNKLQPYVTSAGADALKNGIEVYQRVMGRRGDYSRNPLGAQLDAAEEDAYRVRGLTPRQEQEGVERFVTDAIAESITSMAAYGAGAAALRRLAGLGGVAGAVGRGALAVADPTKARTAVGAVARGVVGNIGQEVATLPLVDNSGNFFTLINSLVGADMLPDSYRPDMDRVEAMGAALVPTAVGAVALPAAVGAVAGGSSGLFRAIARSKRNLAEVEPLVEARQKLEGAGLMERDPETGAYRPPVVPQEQPEAPQAPANWEDAEKAFAEKYGLAPAEEVEMPPVSMDPVEDMRLKIMARRKAQGGQAQAPAEKGGALATKESLELPQPTEAGGGTPMTQPAPEFDLDVDPWEAPPDAVEADVLLTRLEELDDQDRVAIFSNQGAPVVEQIDQVLSQRGSAPINPEFTWDRVSAPRESLADDYLGRYRQKLKAANYDALRDVVVNTPELAAKATAMFGKPVTQLSKREMVKVLETVQERVLLTNRLTGTPMADVFDINVRPEVYQFKQGVNEAGEQAGSSLANVGRWDPEAEGTIQVWRNPETSTLDVVNGHNRLALAKRQGLGTVRVEFLDAFDAADARRQGAIANISSGGGTVWDAAKFIKDSPELTDLASLKASGKPGSSGYWKQGLALAQLPDDLFKAAQDGLIDTKAAVMIGESGLDPEKMRKLYGFATSGPSEGVMRARIELARQAPAGEVSQASLFGDTQVDLTDEKARLYDEVNRALVSDKNLFGRVSRQAGELRSRTATQVDVKGSIAVSEQAKAAQRYFEQVWMTTGPVGDLLNNGALALHRGSQLASVVAEIKQKLPAILDSEMGKATGPVDTSITAPAQRQMALGEEPAQDAGTPEQGAGISRQPEPDTTPAGEPDPVPSEAVQRWEAWSPQKQDRMALLSRKKLLSDRQVATRKRMAAAVEKETNRVQQFLDDQIKLQKGQMDQAVFDANWPEGKDPVLPKGRALKPVKELEEHDAARTYLAWYDQRVQNRELPEPDADAMNIAIVQRALESGEARMPGLEIPEVKDSGIDLEAVARELADGNPGKLTEDAFAEEARLRREQFEQDRAVEAAATDAERAATGWYEQPYEARKAEVVEGFEPAPRSDADLALVDRPPSAPPIPEGRSREELGKLTVKQLRAEAKALGVKGWANWKKEQLVDVIRSRESAAASMADSARRIEEAGRAMAEIALRNDPRTPIANMLAARGASAAVKDLDWINRVRGAGLNEVAEEGAQQLAPGRPELPEAKEEPIGKQLSNGEWSFSSRDRNLVMDQFRKDPQALANRIDAGATRDPDAGDWVVLKSGKDWNVISRHSSEAAAQRAASAINEKNATEAIELVRKARQKAAEGGLQASADMPIGLWQPSERFPTYDSWLDAVENSVLTRMAKRNEEDLRTWFFTLQNRDLGRIAANMADQLAIGMKEAGRISGLDPDKIRMVETINLADIADKSQVIGAVNAWQPDLAQWADARWGSQAVNSYLKSGFADGLQVGETVPYRGGVSPYAGSILIDLTRQVEKKVGSRRHQSLSKNPLWKDLYHESFHAVQRLLSDADQAALRTPKAIKEMEAIIAEKNGIPGAVQSQTELEAESFAAWASDIKLRGDGQRLVDRIFSRIELFTNYLAKRFNDLTGWTPTVKQVFAAAYFGDYGVMQRQLKGASDAEIAAMVRNVNRYTNRYRPQLVAAIREQLEFRLAAVEDGVRRYGEDWFTKDCT